MWAYTNTGSLNCVKVDEVSNTCKLEIVIVQYYNIMANWSTTKKTIFIGSLNCPNFPIRTAKMDPSQFSVGELLFSKQST